MTYAEAVIEARAALSEYNGIFSVKLSKNASPFEVSIWRKYRAYSQDRVFCVTNRLLALWMSARFDRVFLTDETEV